MMDNKKNIISEEEKSPLELLKERMKNIQSGVPDSNTAEVTPGFTIMTDDAKDEDSDIFAKPINVPLPLDEKEDQNKTAKEPVIEENETIDVKNEDTSFSDRMRRFTTNEKGEDVSKQEKPLYTLQSVDEILGKTESNEIDDEIEPPFDYFEDKKETEETSLAEEVTEEKPDDYKGFISDIDVKNDEENEVADKPVNSNTATIRFTPVSINGGENTSMKVDRMTHQFDLGEEFTEKPAYDDTAITDIANNDFDTYIPKAEINDRKDEKTFLRDFAVKKRNNFLASVLGGIILFVMTVFLIPGIYTSLEDGSLGLSVASTVMLGIMAVINGDMVKSVVKTVHGEFTHDFCALLAAFSTILLSVFSIIKGENAFPIILVCTFILFIRAISKFYDVSNAYGNLKVISVPRPKKGVALINDDATTLAMARGSIEGKVMVASAKPTDRISDFMKYTTYKQENSAKISIVVAVSVSLAIVTGILSGIMTGSVTRAFYISSTILCIGALPIAFLIDVLPLKSAATRLNRIGAMLTGYIGADKINEANAVVVRTEDIFPHGSVILKDMKVLSNCNVDDIILRAASLTEAVRSPLSNILKQIASTNAAYDVPPSDTVKYEKQLGISGWVNDELMFIGNRTILQAHGIDVPELKFDHQILKNGYFPVYIANNNMPCVVLIIKYKAEPAISKQLRTAAELGITILVDNTDPNITKDMICDSFDLYEDSVLIMNGAGVSAHNVATSPVSEYSAPAAYRGNSISLLQIMSSAAKVKKSNILLTVLYIISAVIGIVYFIYGAFLGSAPEQGLTVLIFELAATAISLAAFLFRKP